MIFKSAKKCNIFYLSLIQTSKIKCYATDHYWRAQSQLRSFSIFRRPFHDVDYTQRSNTIGGVGMPGDFEAHSSHWVLSILLTLLIFLYCRYIIYYYIISRNFNVFCITFIYYTLDVSMRPCWIYIIIYYTHNLILHIKMVFLWTYRFLDTSFVSLFVWHWKPW